MPLQRFEALAVFKTDQIVRGHRLLDGDRGFGGFQGSFGPARRNPQQGGVDLTDQDRNFRRRRRIVAEIGRHDARCQVDEILARGVGHGLNLLKIVIAQDIVDVAQQPPAPIRLRIRALLSNMSGLLRR